MKKIESSIRKSIKKEIKDKDLIYETLEYFYDSLLAKVNDNMRSTDFDNFVEFENYVLKHIQVVDKINYKKGITFDKVDQLVARAISVHKESEEIIWKKDI